MKIFHLFTSATERSKIHIHHTHIHYCIVGFYCEKKYLQITIFLSEEIFAIFDNCVYNRRYTEDIDPKCVLALIFANALKITKLVKLRLVIKSHYTVYTHV